MELRCLDSLSTSMLRAWGSEAQAFRDLVMKRNMQLKLSPHFCRAALGEGLSLGEVSCWS